MSRTIFSKSQIATPMGPHIERGLTLKTKSNINTGVGNGSGGLKRGHGGFPSKTEKPQSRRKKEKHRLVVGVDPL